jgi:hypothetical protein
VLLDTGMEKGRWPVKRMQVSFSVSEGRTCSYVAMLRESQMICSMQPVPSLECDGTAR